MTLLILSSYSDKHFIEEAMQAGADGYVLKSIDITDLVELIRAFVNKERPMSPYLMDLAVDWEDTRPGMELDEEDDSEDFLTRREKQILDCLARGQGNKEISNSLFISPETVKTHIKNIFKKLDVKSRLEAVIAAKERKLIN
jgi:DNA-binding NarL/FixJ family response regulator